MTWNIYPEDHLIKRMAWDKLYGRLRGKQGNKKLLWYWVAAACLFFALIIPSLNYSDQLLQNITGETAIKQAGQSIKPPSVGQENKKDRNVNAVEPQKNISMVKATSHKKIYRLTSAEMVTKVHPNDMISDFFRINQSKSCRKSNIVLNYSASPSQKKKLNVVHINELGDPVMESLM